MSQEHVEIVRREYAAFAARDWAALAFDSWSDLYAEFRVDAVEIVDAGDQVVTVERQKARGLKGSDADSWVHDSFACLISFKDGKIWRVEEFPTHEQALAAAGPRD